MGRQAHLTRLALGRSPFEPPLRDENGQFILSAHAQDNNSGDYVQLFDEGGHPENPVSNAAARRLRRAQNDVLETVGVVVRKEKMKQDPWQKVANKQKMNLLEEENISGTLFRYLDRLTLAGCSWWLVSLRRRLTTFKSCLGLSVPAMISSEWRIVGPGPFLFAGLPFAAVAGISQSLRDSTREDMEEGPNIFRQPGAVGATPGLRERLLRQGLRTVWFVLEWPFHAFAILQSLHLIPPYAAPPLRSWIPFSMSSPIQAPRLVSPLSLHSIFMAATDALTTPFVLGLLRDQLRQYLMLRIYVVIRHLATKPDRPDRISVQSATLQRELIADTTIPGLGLEIKAKRRYHGPRTFGATMRAAFPTIFAIWDWLVGNTSSPLPEALTPENQGHLRQRASALHRALFRENQRVSREDRPDTLMLRVFAIRAAFREHGLDPDAEMIDIDEWADDLTDVGESDRTTATPDPQDLFDMDEVMDVIPDEDGDDEEEEDGDGDGEGTATNQSPQGTTSSANVADTSQQATAETDTQLPETAVESMTPSLGTGDTSGGPEDAATMPPPVAPLQRLSEVPETNIQPSTPARPETPLPGMSRAPSLSHTLPHLVRRPTETDQDIAVMVEDSRSAMQSKQSRPDQDDGALYRVTVLSNHPADSLSWHASTLITSALLLPFDLLYVRSLVFGFLGHPPHGRATGSSDAIRSDVYPMAPRFGFDQIGLSGCFKVAGNWLLTLAMQGLVSSIVWRIGTSITLRFGRDYGWGKF